MWVCVWIFCSVSRINMCVLCHHHGGCDYVSVLYLEISVAILPVFPPPPAMVGYPRSFIFPWIFRYFLYFTECGAHL